MGVRLGSTSRKEGYGQLANWVEGCYPWNVGENNYWFGKRSNQTSCNEKRWSYPKVDCRSAQWDREEVVHDHHFRRCVPDILHRFYFGIYRVPGQLVRGAVHSLCLWLCESQTERWIRGKTRMTAAWSLIYELWFIHLTSWNATLGVFFCLDIHYTATDQSSAEFSAEVRQTDRDLTKRYPAITLSDSESYSAYLIRVRSY